MTVNNVATLLLGHLSPEERSIPDSVTYPGRNAAVLAAMNGAMQEIFVVERPWIAPQDVGAVLNAPTSVAIELTAGSAVAEINGWADWMAGCTVVIEGDKVDNQILSKTSNPVANFLETNDAAYTENDLIFTQVNPLIPTYVKFQHGGLFVVSSVVVTGGNTVDITASQNFGISSLTASAIIALIEASAEASALVTASLKSGNNGTGRLQTIFGPTLLTGGSGAGVVVKFSSTVTATKNATVYHDCLAIPSTVIDVRSPVKGDGRLLTDTNTRDPRSAAMARRTTDYGSLMQVDYPNRITDTAGRILFYRVETWIPAATSPPQQRMNFFPAPLEQTFIEYKAMMSPPAITDLASTASLPIPLGFVASIYLPLCEFRLMSSPFFRPTMPEAVGNNAATARKELASMNPASHRAPRLIPLG